LSVVTLDDQLDNNNIKSRKSPPEEAVPNGAAAVEVRNGYT